MALLHRIKEVKSTKIFNHFKRYYFQIHTSPKTISDHFYHFQFPNLAKNQGVYPRQLGFLDSRVRFFAAPVQVVKKVEKKRLNRPRLNDEINAEFVRLVTDEGHSVVSRREAQQRAKELKFDLVEVDPDAKPPVCRLMDYKREMYKKQVKGKEKAKIKSAGSLKKSASKEVRFSAKAELKDIKTKTDTVKRLMESGYRVKCTALAAEGRDLSGLLSQISSLIEDVAYVEFGPKMDEKQGYLIVRHIKFGPVKKGNKAPMVLSPTNSGIQTEPSACSDSPVDSEDQMHAGESGTGYDDEESDLDLDDEVQGQATNFIPNVGPASQPENRYARKVPNNEVKAPLQGQAPNFNPNLGPASQPENRYAKKVPNNEVKAPLQGQAPNFNPNVGPASQPENRYAKKVPNNVLPVRNPVPSPNSGSQPGPHSRGLPPVSPRQAGSEGSSSRKSWPRQNGNPQPHGGATGGMKKFGIFSGENSVLGAKINEINQQVTSKSIVLDNPSTSNSDGCATGGKKWGIFSGENSVPGRKG